MPSGVYERTEKIKGSISKALKGRYLSEEWKKKISQALKGKKFSEEHKRKSRGHIPWNKGKHLLEENNIKTLGDALNCEALWNINDGMTLCRNCHKETRTYGWNRYNEILRKEQEFKRWGEFKIPKTIVVK